ncbi:hypothetical protein CA54_16960 [Symmachiella macrocystis]|uniref:Uncharacterized protein n=1 Tax=Symmachiella macrocystis TaxID=2527985 RepID=A0A5C6BL90_9PLAN|nr:hypothetical protein [Symmachiella macrocystis]TWU12870.1 hypothetical protein CA54_16960 [Symmachiella macrocystis]
MRFVCEVLRVVVLVLFVPAALWVAGCMWLSAGLDWLEGRR